MRQIRKATEDEVVLAFLRAEIDSPRFGEGYKKILSLQGLQRAIIIDGADLLQEKHNEIRRKLLGGVRGFGTGQALFRGFPSDVLWRLVSLNRDDVLALKYANHDNWVRLSGETRLVSEVSKRVGLLPATGDVKNVRDVANALGRGKRYPPLIAVENLKGELVLVEGCTRATAYAFAGFSEPVEVFAGSSPQMRNWAFY